MTAADASAIAARLRAAGCVFAEDETRLLLDAARDPGELLTLIERRCAGEPLEVLLGWAQFHGMRMVVMPGVFVPRRRTEFLVDVAIGLARRGDVVVDLCCGSGAIGAALAAAVPGVRLHAADGDPAAVECARRNVSPVDGQVHRGDLYAALPDGLRGQVDLLLVNAPYVPTGEIDLMPPEARLHEPQAAYDGGSDGLDVQRRVAASAAEWLADGGRLLLETSSRQAPASLALLADAGLAARLETSDELFANVAVGTRPRRPEHG